MQSGEPVNITDCQRTTASNTAVILQVNTIDCSPMLIDAQPPISDDLPSQPEIILDNLITQPLSTLVTLFTTLERDGK